MDDPEEDEGQDGSVFVPMLDLEIRERLVSRLGGPGLRTHPCLQARL